jgi:hypothetical protein
VNISLFAIIFSSISIRIWTGISREELLMQHLNIWSGRWIILIVHLQNSMATQGHKAVDDETQGHKAVDDEKISSIWQHLRERRPWCLHKASVMALSFSRIEVLALRARNKQSEEICGWFATASEAESRKRIEISRRRPFTTGRSMAACYGRKERVDGMTDSPIHDQLCHVFS